MHIYMERETSESCPTTTSSGKSVYLHRHRGFHLLGVVLCEKILDRARAMTSPQDSGSPDDLVRFSCLGRVFEAPRHVLTLLPDTKLEAIFSGRWPQVTKNADGLIFLPYPSSVFEALLDWLVTSASEECSVDDPNLSLCSPLLTLPYGKRTPFLVMCKELSIDPLVFVGALRVPTCFQYGKSAVSEFSAGPECTKAMFGGGEGLFEWAAAGGPLGRGDAFRGQVAVRLGGSGVIDFMIGVFSVGMGGIGMKEGRPVLNIFRLLAGWIYAIDEHDDSSGSSSSSSESDSDKENAKKEVTAKEEKSTAEENEKENAKKAEEEAKEEKKKTKRRSTDTVSVTSSENLDDDTPSQSEIDTPPSKRKGNKEKKNKNKKKKGKRALLIPKKPSHSYSKMPQSIYSSDSSLLSMDAVEESKAQKLHGSSKFQTGDALVLTCVMLETGVRVLVLVHKRPCKKGGEKRLNVWTREDMPLIPPEGSRSRAQIPGADHLREAAKDQGGETLFLITGTGTGEKSGSKSCTFTLETPSDDDWTHALSHVRDAASKFSTQGVLESGLTSMMKREKHRRSSSSSISLPSIDSSDY
uniref:Uncharacterized protein n=1 Tax=Chromera velia CCMP2878 TaxID=1169474 RepID=A0A0G4I8J8_9ALVE|eukprot:Cvel_11960.t1-p1 / transcript=Cvel_11960.t1 / gene=Cvel_11960 / organism=Chromera_velia_CCMP2878 / gene_product=hypothetical protein / transcript_product=hypothetical protein / location=Cvel_scaffold766:43182-45313(-) / protein_length=580 / sequence_SO=supercontig / SO=protein_coding / is_pseudo=false